MGFIVEIPLTEREKKKIKISHEKQWEWNESCGEDLFAGEREIRTVEIGGMGFFVDYNGYAYAHCSNTGSLYGEILEAIKNRPHYVDGEKGGEK